MKFLHDNCEKTNMYKTFKEKGRDLNFKLLSKSMKTQHLYFQYLLNVFLSIKIWFSSDNCILHILLKKYSLCLLVVNVHCLKVFYSKTGYMTLLNVPHEWFVFFHRALLADWVTNIFPRSKCRYALSISTYSKIKT